MEKIKRIIADYFRPITTIMCWFGWHHWILQTYSILVGIDPVAYEDGQILTCKRCGMLKGSKTMPAPVSSTNKNSDVEQRLQDLTEICLYVLEMERTRDQPLLPGVDYFSAALDEMEHFLHHGYSPSLDARRRYNEEQKNARKSV